MNIWTAFLSGTLLGFALFAGFNSWIIKEWLYWKKEAEFLRMYVSTPEL